MTELLAGYGAPGRSMRVVIPSDTQDLPAGVRALRFNASGTVKLIAVMDGDEQALTINVEQGEILPCWIRRVFATGTTASDIVAIF